MVGNALRMQYQRPAECGSGTIPIYWVRETFVDENYLIAERTKDGQLLKIPYEIKENGNVEFDDPIPVHIEYVEDEEEE